MPADTEQKAARRSLGEVAGEVQRDSNKPEPPAGQPSEANATDDSAAAWLMRIIQLRRDGRHVDADAELKRFRERYPQVQVPAAALP